MELIKLRDKDINEFKKLMQESFQYGYETVYGSDKEQVLPDKDIDENLKDTDPLKWVGLMNNYKYSAEEIIYSELIYC